MPAAVYVMVPHETCHQCVMVPHETCRHVDSSPLFISLVMYSELRLEKPKFVLALRRETPNLFYFIIYVFHFIVGY